MMAVYIDKDQMYFWVIITESHQYIICIPILNPYPIFCSHFPFLPLTGMMKRSAIYSVHNGEYMHEPHRLPSASFSPGFLFLMHTPAPSPKALAHRVAFRFFLVRGHRTSVSACTRL